MKLVIRQPSLHGANWHTMYARLVTFIALLTFLYCAVRIALMVPDPTISDDALNSSGMRINRTAYDTITDYRRNATARSTAALPSFRDPL